MNNMNNINLSTDDISHILTFIKNKLKQNPNLIFDNLSACAKFAPLEQQKAMSKMTLKFGDDFINQLNKIRKEYINYQSSMPIINTHKNVFKNDVFKTQDMVYSFSQPSKNLELDTIELLNATSKICANIIMRGGGGDDSNNVNKENSIFLPKSANIDTEQEIEFVKNQEVNQETDTTTETPKTTETTETPKTTETTETIETIETPETTTEITSDIPSDLMNETSSESESEQEQELEQNVIKIRAQSIPEEPDTRPTNVEKVNIKPNYPQIVMSNSSYTIDSLSD